MGKTEEEELEPYRIGELVEVSVPVGELQRWDGSVGVIITRRKIVEKQMELPDKRFSDQESFRSLNCWEYEILVRGKTRWFTHYSLLKYEDDYVS
tara:strand:- start:5691 stop:5975 length:285 start_codon:yes stop_codon:yes gene_type:complete